MIFRAKNLEFWTSNWLLEQWTLEMSWVQHKCVLPCLFCVFLVILVRRITITVKSVVFCLFRGYNQPALLLLENQENCYCLLVFLLYLTTSYKRKPISRHSGHGVWKSQKNSHSLLRAEACGQTVFITRQVSFYISKLVENAKIKKKIQMRHFIWFSNNVSVMKIMKIQSRVFGQKVKIWNINELRGVLRKRQET